MATAHSGGFTLVFTQKGLDVTLVISGCTGTHKVEVHEGYACDDPTKGPVWGGTRGTGIFNAASMFTCDATTKSATYTRSGADPQDELDGGRPQPDDRRDPTPHPGGYIMRNILLVAAQRSRVAGGLGVVALVGVAACSGQVSDPNGTNPPNGVTTAPNGAGGATVPVQMPTGPCSTTASLGPSRIWSLTDAEYVSSVASLFGVRLPNEVTVPDTQPADYTNLSEVTTVDSRATEAYQTAAEKAAFAAVTANLDVFMPCGTSDACVTTFIKSRIARAFRRPVTDTEVQDLVALYHTGLADSPATGVRLVIEAALQSPSFIYRTELGPDHGRDREGLADALRGRDRALVRRPRLDSRRPAVAEGRGRIAAQADRPQG